MLRALSAAWRAAPPWELTGELCAVELEGATAIIERLLTPPYDSSRVTAALGGVPLVGFVSPGDATGATPRRVEGGTCIFCGQVAGEWHGPLCKAPR